MQHCEIVIRSLVSPPKVRGVDRDELIVKLNHAFFYRMEIFVLLSNAKLLSKRCGGNNEFRLYTTKSRFSSNCYRHLYFYYALKELWSEQHCMK